MRLGIVVHAQHVVPATVIEVKAKLIDADRPLVSPFSGRTRPPSVSRASLLEGCPPPPPTPKEPMGVISMDTLKKYSYANPGRRYLISVYGNVFDVSDRPDKYGPEGPYTVLTGADITWGLFAGVDTQDYVNRCYDLFKAGLDVGRA